MTEIFTREQLDYWNTHTQPVLDGKRPSLVWRGDLSGWRAEDLKAATSGLDYVSDAGQNTIAPAAGGGGGLLTGVSPVALVGLGALALAAFL